MDKLVEAVEQEFKKKKVPYFKVGDTIKVHTKIIEGDKERIQMYSGVVIGRKGYGLSETFTVSRVTFGYANEKIFPIHSPSIIDIEVERKGNVRKAKLNYIRGRIGKAAKVDAKIGGPEGLYAANKVVESEEKSSS